MNNETKSNFREFFSDKRNLWITIGAVVVIILIVVIANVDFSGHKEPKDMSKLQRMASLAITDPDYAKDRYENEEVSITLRPYSLDRQDGTITFLISPNTDDESETTSLVCAFTCYPRTQHTLDMIKGLDITQAITVNGTVRDVDKNGYVIDIQSVQGRFLPGYKMPTEETTPVDEDTTEADTAEAVDVENTPEEDIGEETPDTAEETSGQTGLVKTDSGLRYYKDGAFQPKFNGIVSYNGKNYMVYHGAVRTNFSGKYVLDGKSYRIVNGVVQ